MRPRRVDTGCELRFLRVTNQEMAQVANQYAAGNGHGGPQANMYASAQAGVAYDNFSDAYAPKYDTRPNEIPFNDISNDNATPYVNQKMKAQVFSARAAFSMLTPDELKQKQALEARLRAGTYDGHLMSNNPPNIGGVTQGGIMGEVGGLYGDTRRIGLSNVVDEGLGDAQIPVIEPSFAEITRDKVRPLNEVINHYLRLDPNLYTGVGGLLPYAESDTTTITYDSWEFEASFAQPTPELSPTRILGYKKKKGQWSFVRYGIGIRNTLDFMDSPEGRSIYYQQVKQIFATVQETNSFGVLYALLTAEGIHAMLIRKLKNYRDQAKELQILEEERYNWGILQTYLGLENLDERISQRFIAMKGQATTWLLTAASAVSMVLDFRNRVDASFAGENLAISAREDSIRNIAQWGRGQVIIVRTFNIDQHVTANPFGFFSMIGEHFLMTNPKYGLGEPFVGEKAFKSLNMAIQKWNESAKDWVNIKLENAVNASPIFAKDTGLPKQQAIGKLPYNRLVDDDGYPFTFHDDKGKPWDTMGPFLAQASRGDESALAELTDSFNENNKQTVPAGAADYTGFYNSIASIPKAKPTPTALTAVNAAAATDYGKIAFTRKNVIALIRDNVKLPFTFLLLQPYMEYQTDCAIKMLPGSATGNTWYKKGKFTAGVDSLVQEYIGSLTYYSKSIVIEPKNVCVVHNAYIRAYEAGANGEFIVINDGKQSDHDPGLRRFGSTDPYVKFAGNGSAPSTRDRPSMYSILVPLDWAHGKGQANPLSLMGHLGVNYGQHRPALEMANSRQYTFPGWEWHNKYWRWDATIRPSTGLNGASADYVNDRRETNSVTWRGPYNSFNPVTGCFGGPCFEKIGTGHFGPKGAFDKNLTNSNTKLTNHPGQIP